LEKKQAADKEADEGMEKQDQGKTSPIQENDENTAEKQDQETTKE